jgi:O-antigen/teichoic acid export membrane protein
MKGSDFLAGTSDSRAGTQLAYGAGVNILGRGLGRVLQAGVEILVARLLGPLSYGLYAIGWTMLQIAGQGAQFGLDQAVIHYGTAYRGYDESKFKNVVVSSVLLAFLSGGIAGALLMVAAPWIAQHVFHKPELTSVIRWFAPAFSFLAGLRVIAGATRITKRMVYSVLAEDLVQSAANIALFLLFYYLIGLRLFGAVAATVSSLAIAALLGIFILVRLYPEIRTSAVPYRPSVAGLLAFSFPTVLAGLFSRTIPRVDRIVIPIFFSATDVGIYAAAARITVLFSIIMGSFGAIASPLFADLFNKENRRELSELYGISTKWSFYLGLPLFLIMLFASEGLLAVLFGGQYLGAVVPLEILAVGQLVNVATGPVGVLLIMTGRQKEWLGISTAALVVAVALNFMLIPRWGIIGAAAASALSVMVLFGGGLLYARTALGIWPYDLRYLKGCLAAIISGACLLLLRAFGLDEGTLGLLLIATCAYLVFFVTLALLGLEKEDREFLFSLNTHLQALRGRLIRN